MRTHSRLAAAGAGLSTFAMILSANAATLTLSPTAPVGNFLTSQMTDLGPGTEEGNRNFTDNGGPLGQTFTAATGGQVGRISILSRGNGASAWTTSAQPFNGTEVFGLLFATVGPGGALQNAKIETFTGLIAPANPTGWLNFDLTTPISVSAGNTYAFSIAQWSPTGMYIGNGWFGVAHSTGDAYTGGTAFNLNSSTVNAGDNNGMLGSDTTAKRYGFIDPSLATPGNAQGYVAPVPGNYDYAFAVQLTPIPEPGALALVALGGLCLAFRKRLA